MDVLPYFDLLAHPGVLSIFVDLEILRLILSKVILVGLLLHGTFDHHGHAQLIECGANHDTESTLGRGLVVIVILIFPIIPDI